MGGTASSRSAKIGGHEGPCPSQRVCFRCAEWHRQSCLWHRGLCPSRMVQWEGRRPRGPQNLVGTEARICGRRGLRPSQRVRSRSAAWHRQSCLWHRGLRPSRMVEWEGPRPRRPQKLAGTEERAPPGGDENWRKGLCPSPRVRSRSAAWHRQSCLWHRGRCPSLNGAMAGTASPRSAKLAGTEARICGRRGLRPSRGKVNGHGGRCPSQRVRFRSAEWHRQSCLWHRGPCPSRMVQWEGRRPRGPQELTGAGDCAPPGIG
jgi:hypothetical protein